MKHLTSLLAIFLLTSCANQTAQQKSDDASALNLAFNAATSYASGNDVAAALNALSAASYLMRSLQSTPAAASAPAVTSTVQSAGVGPKTSAAIASAVSALTANGTAPSKANEKIASQIDAAVKQASNSQVDARLLRSHQLSREEYATLRADQRLVEANRALTFGAASPFTVTP